MAVVLPSPETGISGKLKYNRKSNGMALFFPEYAKTGRGQKPGSVSCLQIGDWTANHIHRQIKREND